MVGLVVPIKNGFGQMRGGDGWQTRDVEDSGGKVFEAFGCLGVEKREVEKSSKS